MASNEYSNELESFTIESPYGGTEDTCAKFTINDVTLPFNITAITTVGEYYTLSFWVKSESTGELQIYNGLFPTDSDWKKYVVSFAANNTKINLYFTTTGTYYIYHPKLEIGNKATDWSPAPEDTDERVSVLRTDFNTYIEQTDKKISLKAEKTEITRIDDELTDARKEISELVVTSKGVNMSSMDKVGTLTTFIGNIEDGTGVWKAEYIQAGYTEPSSSLYFDFSKGQFIFNGAIVGGSINISDNFCVDKYGNVTLNGSITWGAGNSPTQAVYATSALTKPADGTAWSSFSVSGSDWHQSCFATDYYASYTYDGGASWTDAILIRGIDGEKGDTGAQGAQGATGAAGDPGDSITIMYLYYRQNTPYAPSAPSYTGSALPSGWTERPSGVTSYYKYEFVSQCTVTNDSYGSWSDPVLWAKYGEDGSDADVTDVNVFNAITSNGTLFGCFNNGDNTLYINANYISSGTISSTYLDTSIIHASSGYIGGYSGFTIGDGKLYSNGKAALDTDKQGVYIGTDGIAVGRDVTLYDGSTVTAFTVTNAGYITTAGGEFGGIRIYNGVISTNGKTSESSSTPGLYISDDGIGLGSGDFYVDDNGYLVFNAATVYGDIKTIGGDAIITNSSGTGIKISDTSISYYSIQSGAGPSVDFSSSGVSISKLDSVYTTELTVTGESTTGAITCIDYIKVQVGDSDEDGMIINNWSVWYTSNGLTSGPYIAFSSSGMDLYPEEITMGTGDHIYIGVTTAFQIDISSAYIEFLYDNSRAGKFDVYSSYVRILGTFKDESSSIVATSDARLKNSISDFVDAHDILFDNLHPRTYKWNNGTSGRTHSGFVVQEILEAVETAGLTTQDFAAVVHFLDENGEDESWGMRYDEIISLNTWQIQKLKARVAELEETIQQLKEKTE